MFKEIPGYSRYVIDRKGNVFNRSKGHFLEGSINPAGYVNFRIQSDSGVTLTWGRHRLLAYVFMNPGEDIENLVVNHKNGIKGDDRLENLEWVTQQGNVYHAGENKLSSKCIPVIVRDIVKGTEEIYPSAIAAAEEIGLSKDALLWRLKCDPCRIFPEMKQYKSLHDETPWPFPSREEINNVCFGSQRPLLLKNIETGEVMEFEYSRDLCHYLSVLPSTVSLWSSKKDQPLILKKFLLKDKADTTPWREVGDIYLENEKSTRQKAVVAYNERECFKYFSIAECARDRGLTVPALFDRLKNGKRKMYRDGFRYCYYSEFNSPSSE